MDDNGMNRYRDKKKMRGGSDPPLKLYTVKGWNVSAFAVIAPTMGD